jgi:acetyl esterase
VPVDPELLSFLKSFEAMPGLDKVPLEFLRSGPLPLPMPEPLAMARVTNRRIPAPEAEIPVRIYHPRAAAGLPILVYYHGGGWVLGSLETHDTIARALAAAADCIVVSVDYRLAPEHPFPAAITDSVAAARWVGASAAELGGDSSRICVGGDSAGGNIATVVAAALRDAGGPPLAGQLLIYPATRLRAPREGSLVSNAQGYFLTTADVDWFEDHYLGKTIDAADPRVSPLLAGDLSRLPPALLITAQFDPLLDQGAAYARRLSEAGVDCTYVEYEGAIHGFFGTATAIGQRAISQSAQWLKTLR